MTNLRKRCYTISNEYRGTCRSYLWDMMLIPSKAKNVHSVRVSRFQASVAKLQDTFLKLHYFQKASFVTQH